MIKNVLIVDDNEQSRKIAKYALSADTDLFTEAHDGEDALERILNEKPTLIILDWMMPKLSGSGVVLLTDNIITQMNQLDNDLGIKNAFQVIIYSSVKIPDLSIPKARHFRFISYISKEWSLDYQLKRFRSISSQIGTE